LLERIELRKFFFLSFIHVSHFMICCYKVELLLLVILVVDLELFFEPVFNKSVFHNQKDLLVESNLFTVTQDTEVSRFEIIL